MTEHDLVTSFEQHMKGIKVNKYAMKYELLLIVEI